MSDLKFSKYQRSDRKAKLVSSAVSGILALAGMQVALAADEGPSGQAKKEEALTEVTVTGSRIVRRDLEASSPLVTVPAERFEQSAQLSVESVLNQMTQFTPGQTQFSAQGEIQTSPSTSLGIGTASLRGLGTNRTLVLVDGRRAQPANAALVVDLNTIPSAAIERVETITGGASAVYGADALAGVVNFVLKDKFQGLALDLQGGTTQEHDANETRFSALAGTNTADGHGNIMFGVEWYKRGTAYQKDRAFYRDGWNDPNNQITTSFPSMPGYAQTAGNLPSQAAVDSLFPQYAPGTISPNNTFYFNKNGTAFVRTPTGAPGFDTSQYYRPDTGDGFYGLLPQKNGTLSQQYEDGAMSSPLQRRSLFAKAHYGITDQVEAFTQGTFSHTDVNTFSAGPPPAVGTAWGGSIPNDGRTDIPAGLQTLLNSRPTPTANWQLNRGLDFLGQFGPTNTSDVYQVLGGLKGSFKSNDWTWEAFASSGQTTTTNYYPLLPSVQQWQALVASPNFGTGADLVSAQGGNYQIKCTSGLPIFYGTTASTTQDCLNGINGNFKSLTKLSQNIIEADLQGGLMKLPAGQLRFALGADYRTNGFDYSPTNPQPSIYDFPLGLFVSNPTTGRTTVKEVYGELLVPIISRVSLELGYRESEYNSNAGRVPTWKALLDWQITDWARFRGGYQVANRAPNTAELYQSETTIFDQGFTGGDPCGVNTTSLYGNVPGNPNRAKVQQLCAALIGNNGSLFGAPGSVQANTYLLGQSPFTGINGISVGNPDLDAEKGKTWTAGFVFQNPIGINGLSASVDYYNITVTNAIGTFTGLQIYQNCFNVNGVSNPNYSVNDPGGFCKLINRDSGTGATGTVSTTYLNTGFVKTSGEDVEVDYKLGMPFGGSMYLNNQVSFLNKFETQTTASTPSIEWKGTLGNGGQFSYRLNSTLGYNFQNDSNANIGLRMHYLPSIKDATYATSPTTNVLPAKHYTDFDLFGSLVVFHNWQLRAGIDNLLYTKPVVVGAIPGDDNSNQTNAGYYDILGRRFYVGVHGEF
ncbi:MAG TPA: TonB-dependent receptor [Steroidobacteraceae bacterium]|jgi:outer membrane receptor protein involved in Fe transport